MPYRGRPIRWDLLLRPTMQGLATEAQADARMNQNVMGGLLSIGDSIKTGRQAKESKRRYEKDYDLREGHLQLRKDQVEAEQARIDNAKSAAQAHEAHLLGVGEAALPGAVQGDPAATETVNSLIPALGGAEAAVKKSAALKAHDAAVAKPQVVYDEDGKVCPGGI